MSDYYDSQEELIKNIPITNNNQNKSTNKPPNIELTDNPSDEQNETLEIFELDQDLLSKCVPLSIEGVTL